MSCVSVVLCVLPHVDCCLVCPWFFVCCHTWTAVLCVRGSVCVASRGLLACVSVVPCVWPHVDCCLVCSWFRVCGLT